MKLLVYFFANMRNLSEMSRLARLAEVWLGQREPEPEKLWLPMPLDLSEDEKEIFLQYWVFAERLFVNPEDDRLIEAFNAHLHHIEDAFVVFS